MLLDEPGGVDPVSRQDLWQMGRNWWQRVWRWCGQPPTWTRRRAARRLLLLAQGKIVFDGPPQDSDRPVARSHYLMRDIRGNRRPP